MKHTFTTHNDELGAKLKKVMDEHQAAKDPYPHYYRNLSDIGVLRFDAADMMGVFVIDSGDLCHTASLCPENNHCLTRLTKAEFEARVEAAQDKARRWAEGSIWTTNGQCVWEWCSEHLSRTYESGIQIQEWFDCGQTMFDLVLNGNEQIITPTRAREILAGWKAEREVKIRCFEFNCQRFIALVRFVEGEPTHRIRNDGTRDYGARMAAGLSFYEGNRNATEFPPAEWDRRVKALQPDPYAEAKAAYADGVLQFRDKPCGLQAHSGEWIDHSCEFKPAYCLPPEQYRRRPTTKKTITVACSECGSHISYCPYCGKHMKVRINQGE